MQNRLNAKLFCKLPNLSTQNRQRQITGIQEIQSKRTNLGLTLLVIQVLQESQ